MLDDPPVSHNREKVLQSPIMPSSIEHFLVEEETRGQDSEDSSPSRAPPSSRAGRVTGCHRIFVFLSLLSSALLFAFDQTVTADSQEGIVASLHSTAQVQWISVPFMLGAVLGRNLWLQLYGSFTLRNVYLVTILTFCLGSIICSTAPAMRYLILGRAISGAGGSGMYIGALRLFASMSTDQERSQCLGIPALIWGLATILGPIGGEAFSSSPVGWRFSFYINLVVCAVFTPALLLLPSSAPARDGPRHIASWVRSSDPVGTILIGGIYLTGLIAISVGGIAYDWTDHRILLLLATCASLVLLYCIQQATRSTHAPPNAPPAIPDHGAQFLKNPRILVACLMEACSTTSIFVTVYFIPLYLEVIHDKRILLSALHVLPTVAALTTMLIATRAITARLGHADVSPWLFSLGGLLILAGGLLLTSLPPGPAPLPPSLQILAASLAIGAGVGMHVQLPFSADLPPPPHALLAYAQLAMPAVMLSFADTVYLDQATVCIEGLVTNLSRPEIQELVAGGPADNASVGVGHVVKGCVGKSIEKVFVIVAVTGALIVAATLLMHAGDIWPASRRKEMAA